MDDVTKVPLLLKLMATMMTMMATTTVTLLMGTFVTYTADGDHGDDDDDGYKKKLEIAQSEQDVSPFCKESDMTYS